MLQFGALKQGLETDVLKAFGTGIQIIWRNVTTEIT